MIKYNVLCNFIWKSSKIQFRSFSTTVTNVMPSCLRAFIPKQVITYFILEINFLILQSFDAEHGYSERCWLRIFGVSHFKTKSLTHKIIVIHS